MRRYQKALIAAAAVAALAVGAILVVLGRSEPDFVLIGPGACVILGEEKVRLTLIAFRFKRGGPQKVPEKPLDPADPNDGPLLDASYVRMGPIPADWRIDGSASGPGPQPEVALIGTTTRTTTITVTSPRGGGEMKPGIVARTLGGLEASARVIVPYMGGVEIEPAPAPKEK